jgi:hypothetical protein
VGVTLDLPDGLARRLATEAERGVRLVDLVADPAAQLPSAEASSGRRFPFVGVGASLGGVTIRMDDLLADSFGRD